MVWAVINPAIQEAIGEFADNTSDRACAIVGASMVDEALLRALESRMRPGGIRDFFFKPTSPTGSFAAKYRLGYLLGAYDDVALRAMEGIADIRNQFAHQLPIKTFDDANLQASLKKLALHTTYQKYPHPFHEGDSAAVESVTSNREQYIVNAKLLLVLLMRDLRLHDPNSNQFRPLPAGPVTPIS